MYAYHPKSKAPQDQNYADQHPYLPAKTLVDDQRSSLPLWNESSGPRFVMGTWPQTAIAGKRLTTFRSHSLPH